MTAWLSWHLQVDQMESSTYNMHITPTTTIYYHYLLPLPPFYSHYKAELECGPMPNVMVALPNIVGTLCSMPQSLADAHY